MVDVIGHLGMALIWLAPAWFVINRTKTALTFVGVGFWFGMLPDVDLVLSNWFPQMIHHHGVLHTVLFALVAGLVLGPVVGWILKKVAGDSEWMSRGATANAYTLGFLMVFVPATAHVFADMLSAPDIAQAVEPFWPVYKRSVGIDVVYYNSTFWNWAFFLTGLALNGAGWWANR